MPPTDSFPWQRVMQLGLGALRLPPEHFWRMTLRELLAAHGLGMRPAGVSRATLLNMMQLWPDDGPTGE